MAREARELSRAQMMDRAAEWAERPALTSRLGALLFLGDLGVHHQDILRGLGRAREVPEPVARAILREGMHLSMWMNRRVLRHRLVLTDGDRTVGRGREVRGTREARACGCPGATRSRTSWSSRRPAERAPGPYEYRGDRPDRGDDPVRTGSSVMAGGTSSRVGR